MEMFGGSKYQGEALTIVYIENHGRRPVTIKSVGRKGRSLLGTGFVEEYESVM